MRGVSAGPFTSQCAARTTSRGPTQHRPPCDAEFRTDGRPHPVSDKSRVMMEDVIDGSGGPHDTCAAMLVAALMIDVLDELHPSEDKIQDVDGLEEETDAELCGVQLFSPTCSAVGTASMAGYHSGIDGDDSEEVSMLMDGEDLDDDDHEMEAAGYIHLALRFARAAVAAGIEDDVKVEAEAAREAALLFGNEAVSVEPAKSSASAVASRQHSGDMCSIHIADSDEEHVAEDSRQVLGSLGMKTITSGPSEDQEVETLRIRAHRVLQQASSDGSLFSALKQVRSMQNKSHVRPQHCSFPVSVGPAREAHEFESVGLVGSVQRAEPVQIEEFTAQQKAKVSNTLRQSGSNGKSRPSTSAPNAIEVVSPSSTGRFAQTAIFEKDGEALSNVKPTVPAARSLHTSRSRRKGLGGVARKQTSSCEGVSEKQQSPSSPSRHASTGLHRHRSKHSDSASAFRMDSPACSKQGRDLRGSSLARTYEALGAEMHCLDDGHEVGSYFCGSRSVGGATLAGSLHNSSSSRKIAATGLGCTPFAAALDPHVGLHGAPFSAIALDLGGDVTASTTLPKSTSSTQQRPSSLGAERVSKSKQSLGFLPFLPTSKSRGLLPSPAVRPGHPKHRSQDPLARSMGWGSMSIDSVV